MEGPVRRLSPRARFALRAALFVAFLLGAGGSIESCGFLRFYHDPRPEVSTDIGGVFIDILERFRSTHVPLAVADLLLSLALAVAVVRTATRRAGAKSWLRQVCVATALYAVVEFVANRPERAYLEESLRAHPIEAKEASALRLHYDARPIGLLVQLAFLGALVFALGRPSVVLELAPRDSSRRSFPPSSDGDDG